MRISIRSSCSGHRVALVKGDQVTENMSFVRLPDKMQAFAFKALSGVTDQKGRALGLEAMSEQNKP